MGQERGRDSQGERSSFPGGNRWRPERYLQLSCSASVLVRAQSQLKPSVFKTITYTIKSRNFAGCGNLPGWGPAHMANLFASHSLPGHLQALSVCHFPVFIFLNSLQPPSPTTSHEAYTETLSPQRFACFTLRSQVSLPHQTAGSERAGPWRVHIQDTARGLPPSKYLVRVY